nr:DUF2145 domain-containing protein [Diaphorobacter aerolatus]
MAAGPAHAGRSCEQKPPTVQTIRKGMELAGQTARALDATGAKLVMLGRAGQDLSKYQLRYSHLGWAYKTPEGRWRVVHKLNECGTAVAHIYRQGLGEFFLDDLWRYEAVWVVPNPEVQERMLSVLQDRRKILALHQPRYNMVSYPWATKYQQSNQWALEALAMAMEPTVTTREQAQAWLRFKGYEPSAMKIGAMTRLGGRMTSANVAFDDHPNEKRFADRIETVTVDSVMQFAQRAQLSGAQQTLRID